MINFKVFFPVNLGTCIKIIELVLSNFKKENHTVILYLKIN